MCVCVCVCVVTYIAGTCGELHSSLLGGIRNISNLRKNISLDTTRAINYARLSETCKGSHQVSNK